MADQAASNVNKIFSSTVGKEGTPATVVTATGEAMTTKKVAAASVAATEEMQEKEHAALLLHDIEDLVIARQVIEDVGAKQKEEELTNIEQIATNSLKPEPVLINIEAIATKIPEKPVDVINNRADNGAEVAAFTREAQVLYTQKAEKERAANLTTETGINEVVVNGIKQKIDAEQTIRENLGKNPEQARTWRAWLSDKLRKMMQIFAKEKKEKILAPVQPPTQKPLETNN